MTRLIDSAGFHSPVAEAPDRGMEVQPDSGDRIEIRRPETTAGSRPPIDDRATR